MGEKMKLEKIHMRVQDEDERSCNFEEVALGYSLGPVAIQAQYKQADNVAGYSGSDVDVFAVKVGTRF